MNPVLMAELHVEPETKGWLLSAWFVLLNLLNQAISTQKQALHEERKSNKLYCGWEQAVKK